MPRQLLLAVLYLPMSLPAIAGLGIAVWIALGGACRRTAKVVSIGAMQQRRRVRPGEERRAWGMRR